MFCNEKIEKIHGFYNENGFICKYNKDCIDKVMKIDEEEEEENEEDEEYDIINDFNI